MQQSPDDDLRARLERAERAIAARDDFLAVAAHELRSPLNALALRLASLEIMAQRFGAAELHADIERTRRSVDRYVRRAVVLLDVSRLNSPDVQVAREPVPVAELVRNVVESHRDEAAFHGTTVEAQVEGEPQGCWDAHMAEEILSNLVNNAIKYGGGTPVRVRAWADEATASFEVSDEGPGLDAAQREKVFEKFERVVSGSRSSAGFGLGLWIVGRMVAAHGGRVEVTSEPQRGTRFLVHLPLAPEQCISKESET